MNHQILTINLKNILYNFKLLSSLTENKVIPMVKADAYGHRAVDVSKYLEENTSNIEAFGVAKLQEAIELRNNKIKSNIIVLSEVINDENIKQIKKYDLVPVIFELSSLNIIIKYKIPYIIKLDSGMNRLGFKEYDLDKLENIKQHKPSMIMTHFSVAEENNEFTNRQINNFNKFIKKLDLKDIPVSLSNSSALINGINNNIPRIGISMYGVNYTQNKKLDPKPTMSLESEIIAIKSVKKGEVMSYGNTLIEIDTNIAIVAIGYADGYSRNLSNKSAIALTKLGKIVQIGKVCMDVTIFDIKDLDLKVGDDVLLFGESEFGEVDIKELANKADTIAYEFFTNRTRRLKTRYIK